jgi:hypothetical protein
LSWIPIKRSTLPLLPPVPDLIPLSFLSSRQLRYFVRWENGQSRLKGEVDVDTIGGVAVIGKDIRLSTDERIWYFQADTEDEAAFWRVVLSSLIPLSHGIITTQKSTDFTM